MFGCVFGCVFGCDAGCVSVGVDALAVSKKNPRGEFISIAVFVKSKK